MQIVRGLPTAPTPAIYCLLALTISGATGALFFKVNGMFPFAWHYVPFIVMSAVAFDCSIQNEKYANRISAGKVCLAVILALISIPDAWDAAHLRRSNMDSITAVLQAQAQPTDLILVNPFWLRPSFKFHYRGSVPWRIVPVDPDDDIKAWHAGGLSIRKVMMKSDSIRPTLDLVQATLRGGGRVWIVGGIDLPPEDKSLPELIPAPHPRYGWNNNAYSKIWSLYLGRFLQLHASEMQDTVLPEDAGVSELYLENQSLILVEGWR